MAFQRPFARENMRYRKQFICGSFLSNQASNFSRPSLQPPVVQYFLLLRKYHPASQLTVCADHRQLSGEE
jgi:hypothetical protein